MSEQIPGAEAFPEGVEDAPHGDVSLEYNVQNFNALVAANTAMIGEISSLNIRLGDLSKWVEDLQSSLKMQQATAAEKRETHAATAKALDEALTENNFLRDSNVALQRRLDRTAGYLDRTLDEEARIDTPATQTVAAPKPSVGPRLEDIDMPRRSNNDQWHGVTARLGEPYVPERRRRY